MAINTFWLHFWRPLPFLSINLTRYTVYIRSAHRATATHLHPFLGECHFQWVKSSQREWSLSPTNPGADLKKPNKLIKMRALVLLWRLQHSRLLIFFFLAWPLNKQNDSNPLCEANIVHLCLNMARYTENALFSFNVPLTHSPSCPWPVANTLATQVGHWWTSNIKYSDFYQMRKTSPLKYFFILHCSFPQEGRGLGTWGLIFFFLSTNLRRKKRDANCPNGYILKHGFAAVFSNRCVQFQSKYNSLSYAVRYRLLK